MNVKFYLKSPKEESSLVILSWQNNPNERIRLSTGIKVYSSSWNKKKQRIRVSVKFKGDATTNILLDKIASSIKELSSKYKLTEQRNPTKEEIKQLVYKLTARNLKVDSDCFLTFCKEEYEKRSKLPQFSKGRLKQYRNAIRNITTFNDKYYQIKFSNIDNDFCNDFITFLFNDEELGQNTVWTRVNVSRTFLNAANDKGKIDKEKYKGLRVKEFVPQLTYLNKDDLQKIKEADLSNDLKLDKIRDRVLVSCYTAMRFSDVSKLDAEKHFNLQIKMEYN